MNMKASIFTAAPMAIIFAGLLPAADPQLLSMVMPDAKVMAGVNVDQAKASPFGVFVLVQLQAQNQQLQQLIDPTGFDPTRDLNELLVASNGAQPKASSLVLARGTFDAGKIQSAALAGGATIQPYGGTTLLLDPKGANAVAFLNGIAIAGDIASVKGALGRQNASPSFDPTLLTQVNQLSSTEDAWAVSEIPPPAAALTPPANSPAPAVSAATMLQKITQASGGVKFNDPIVVTATAQTSNPTDATTIAGELQFLANLGQMQGQQNPQRAAILKSLTATASGNSVQISLSVPEAQAEAAVQTGSNTTAQPNSRRPRRRL